MIVFDSSVSIDLDQHFAVIILFETLSYKVTQLLIRTMTICILAYDIPFNS